MEFLVTRHFDCILAMTFDHDLQMTLNWYHSKALVEAHLFRGVLKFDPLTCPSRPRPTARPGRTRLPRRVFELGWGEALQAKKLPVREALQAENWPYRQTGSLMYRPGHSHHSIANTDESKVRNTEICFRLSKG